MAAAKELDKRVERSRRLLVNTLLKLMAEKPYSKLSVANICEHSGVARPTFYLHFRSKDDLLRYYIEQMFLEFAEQIDPILTRSPNVDPEIAVLMFRQWQLHSDVAKLLVAEDVEAILLNEFKTYVGRTIERYIEAHKLNIASNSRIHYVIDYLAGASFAVIVRWIREDFNESPEELASLYADLSRPGLLQVLLSGKL
ncbi:TetR/AcrR family transcriptional regulator [Thalassolituus sp. UBA2590]|uniref:TetR/AcrR family transcriptional regulator n=1 Tax=unclassified Thalassolituus TaxID=2624967 RepID=UPI002623CA29|nr:TetR/AcrR family transcriptional regulator [Thalassolituus sp. UBA2590]MED5441441.1 TetR/AcrR family transcriptional regulator [Pseudomonadota bacterium]MEE3160842.1 TetR/AcrR family transcriptional regulator [Pseudomonadota bacterium]